MYDTQHFTATPEESAAATIKAGQLQSSTYILCHVSCRVVSFCLRESCFELKFGDLNLGLII